MKRLHFLCISLLAGNALANPVNDGPYVFHNNEGATAHWLCAGDRIIERIATDRQMKVPCGDIKPTTLYADLPEGVDEAAQPERWAAISDMHGQYDLTVQLLKAQGIIDSQLNWAYGRGVLVIPGDIFDRGDKVNELLWLVYRLEQQARQAGGAVHFLLGNHEYMVMQGDLRYINPTYQRASSWLGRRYDQLYGPDSEMGRWLRRKATVLKLGDTLFVHGGLARWVSAQDTNLSSINRRYRETLDWPTPQRRDTPDVKRLYSGTESPIWHRGYIDSPRAAMSDVEAVLRRYGAQRIVVGHTTLKEIKSLYQGKVIGIDCGIKNGESAQLLRWENHQLSVGDQHGSRTLLPAGKDDGSTELEKD